ncbi:MAG: hypothetical protein AAFV90_26510 [Cyanobacteria bacterium J06634_5]
MNFHNSDQPDLDAITRNLIALDIARISPEEATAYEHELSVIAALNDALETTALALQLDESPRLWQRLQPMLSDAAALLSSQIAPLLDLNAERHFEISEHPTRPPLALTSSPSRDIASYRAS